ncbi:MAG: DUF2088 domain-containing protein [Bacillota bacterium]
MLPGLIPVRQAFSASSISNVAAAMERALAALALDQRVRPGMRIGIPAGSRGISQIPLLLRVVVDHVRRLGGEPVLVTAMGSHGGGTAAGQLSVLESLGITETAVGGPVVGNVEATVVATAAGGEPVYFDRVLAGCDGLVVINRVKPHTSFHGPLESGLTKMLVVGCGKPPGALQFHNLGAALLAERLRQFGKILLERLPVLGGVAVLENGREEIADLVPVHPDSWVETEEQLLERARALLPRLPVNHLDLLVIDEMGKNISGTGMDTNVIGRMGIRGVPEDRGPEVGRIVVLDLTESSHGNANGMGLADFVTRRLADKVDFKATYLNTLTATFVERAKLPIVMESDREAMETALRTLGSPPEPRIIRIKNTLELERIWVSPAVLRELDGLPSVTVEGGPEDWPFDATGNLPLK